MRVSPVYRASMRLAVCERTRRTPVRVLHSFLSGVTRAARRDVPLFIINEGEDRGKGQWGERKRAAGTHAQLRKKEKKKAGSATGATCLRVRIGEERDTEGEGGEKGERGREGGGDTEREAATATRAGAAEEAAGGA